MLPLEVPVQPGRDQARQWAVEELSRREYQAAQPGLIDRGLTWLLQHLTGLFDRLPPGPGPALAAGVAAILLLAVLGYAVWRVGGLGRQARTRSDSALYDGTGPQTPEQHRAAADRAAAAGDWRAAVLERFRAIVRELEERTVLTPQPGRTAAEAAELAAGALPELRPDLIEAGHLFDDVRYGGRSASPGMDATLRGLDGRVRRAKVRVP